MTVVTVMVIVMVMVVAVDEEEIGATQDFLRTITHGHKWARESLAGNPYP
jgi:hypothetical protein